MHQQTEKITSSLNAIQWDNKKKQHKITDNEIVQYHSALNTTKLPNDLHSTTSKQTETTKKQKIKKLNEWKKKILTKHFSSSNYISVIWRHQLFSTEKIIQHIKIENPFGCRNKNRYRPKNPYSNLQCFNVIWHNVMIIKTKQKIVALMQVLNRTDKTHNWYWDKSH